MAEQDEVGVFAEEQSAFVSILDEAGGKATGEVLGQRCRMVKSFEGLLEATQYISFSGDFHLQDPMGSGKPSNSGYSVVDLRQPSSEVWVGPLNRQTAGYAELSGDIHTFKRNGLLPFVAWRGEPWLRPGYPLIADMSKLAVKSVDERAEDFTATREFGTNRRLYGPYWNRLEGRSISDIHKILDRTYRELLVEGDSELVPIPKTEAEAYTANLGQGFAFHNMFITFASDGSLERIEAGPFYGSGWNSRFDFIQVDDGSIVIEHRPHTSFNHKSDYVAETTRIVDLGDDRRSLAVMDFRQMLGDVERLVMAPKGRNGHATGFGSYAKDRAV